MVVIIIGANFYLEVMNQAKPAMNSNKQNGDAENIEEKLNRIEIYTSCESDLDCSWQITNCCTANSGADWQCISRESEIECNEFVLCPAVLSPKPEENCSCAKSECVVG